MANQFISYLQTQWSGGVALNQLGILHIVGADAKKFLQNQITQNLDLIQPYQSLPAAICSAKGRILVNFVLGQLQEDVYFMVLLKSEISYLVQHFNKYKLRSLVQFLDQSLEYTVFGQAEPSSELTDPLWRCVHTNANQFVVHLPQVEQVARSWCIRRASSHSPTPALDSSLDSSVWQAVGIMAGDFFITPANRDAFIPQMLHFEQDGVSFSKGCYPGQEVIARSQYRGTVKRTVFQVLSTAAVQVGQEWLGQNDMSSCSLRIVETCVIAGMYLSLVCANTASQFPSRWQLESDAQQQMEFRAVADE